MLGGSVKVMLKRISIEKKEYDELVAAQKLLQALEAAGVDSWEGYELARESME